MTCCQTVAKLKKKEKEILHSLSIEILTGIETYHILIHKLTVCLKLSILYLFKGNLRILHPNIKRIEIKPFTLISTRYDPTFHILALQHPSIPQSSMFDSAGCPSCSLETHCAKAKHRQATPVLCSR